MSRESIRARLDPLSSEGWDGVHNRWDDDMRALLEVADAAAALAHHEVDIGPYWDDLNAALDKLEALP